MRKWNRITIVGCGLIGASFALALRKRNACNVIAGWDSSPSVLDEALQRGIIDEVDTGGTASNLIYLSMPVGEIINFLKEPGRRIAPGAVVTDTGSTKVSICLAARVYLPEGIHFIGGHPIAGSQHAGLAHARADLFERASYVLTTDDWQECSKESIALRETIELIGAHATFMMSAEHDRALALLSHLPQLLSSALAAAIEEQPNAAALLALAGPGYHDMTRLSTSDWSMWRDILATSPLPIANALDQMIEKLAALRDELRKQVDCPRTALPLARQLFQRSQQN